MAAPGWLRQAIEEHGAQAVAEGWTFPDWMVAGVDTEYRAKECVRVMRTDPDKRLSPPTLDGLTDKLDGWQSPRQRRKAPVEVTTTKGDDGRAGNWHEINESTGDYRFWVLGRSRPVIMTRDQVHELIGCYVADGENQTQAALARRFFLPRRVVNAILKALGVVKDSPPFTPQDIAEGDPAELEAEWVASKAAKIERSAHRKVWAAESRDAQKWRDLHLSTLQYIGPAVRAAVEGMAPLELPEQDEPGAVALLIVPTDVHIGKRGWEAFGPGGIDMPETQRRLSGAVGRVLALCPGAPDVIYLTIGGDLFHVDNADGSTTRGTPQDMDCTPEEMVRVGFAVMFALVRQLAQVAPVRLVLHAGNHDAILSLALYAALCEAFGGSGVVEPAGDPAHPYGPYQAVRFGKSLIGFTHGDGRHKVADLGPLMAQRWPRLWGETRHRYWFTGHRHHLRTEEARGVEVHVCPSLSGADRYHARHWPHETRPRLGGYVFDPERGMVATVFGDVD